jgi:hypothetical protein
LQAEILLKNRPDYEKTVSRSVLKDGFDEKEILGQSNYCFRDGAEGLHTSRAGRETARDL